MVLNSMRREVSTFMHDCHCKDTPAANPGERVDYAPLVENDQDLADLFFLTTADSDEQIVNRIDDAPRLD
jgi:hypothetical protein